MALDLNYDPNWKPQGDSGPDLTYDPNWTPPKAPEGGLIASLKQATGNLVKGAGQAAADYLPGVSQDNALKQHGQEVIDANPTAVRSLSDIATSPWTATKEAVGNAVGSMGAMVGANVAGRGLEAVAPFTGPARPIVSLLGKGLQVAGPVVAAGLPSYGGIREAQIQEDPTRADDAGAKARALAGAGAVGLIERSFGPEKLALSALSKEGRAKVIESMAGKSLAGSIGKGMAKGAAVEGAEELAQNPIEQFAAYQDPTTPENIEETLFGGAMGALGGGVLGGAGGGASYMARPEQPKVDPTAGPLSRAAATAQETGAAGLAQVQTGEGMSPGAEAAADPITARLAGVASFAEDKEFLRALRNDGRFGAESVTELLGAYATARNPNADPTVRETALNAIEQFTGAFVGPSAFGGQQNFTMQSEPDTFVREPREQTGMVPFQGGALAQPGADPFDPNTLDGQAREVGTLPRQMLAGPEDAATQYRRELLESVLSDPETKNPLPRYESLLKKNGFEQRRATPEERKLIEDRTVSQAETARAELPPFAAVEQATRPAFPLSREGAERQAAKRQQETGEAFAVVPHPTVKGRFAVQPATDQFRDATKMVEPVAAANTSPERVTETPKIEHEQPTNALLNFGEISTQGTPNGTPSAKAFPSTPQRGTAQQAETAAEQVRAATPREAAVADRAEPVLDLNKRPTGWKQVDYPNGDGVLLISADGKKAINFPSRNAKSGTESLRAQAKAQAFAIDNPHSTNAPQGELVVKPIFEKRAQQAEVTNAQSPLDDAGQGAAVAAKGGQGAALAAAGEAAQGAAVSQADTAKLYPEATARRYALTMTRQGLPSEAVQRDGGWEVVPAQGTANAPEPSQTLPENRQASRPQGAQEGATQPGQGVGRTLEVRPSKLAAVAAHRALRKAYPDAQLEVTKQGDGWAVVDRTDDPFTDSPANAVEGAMGRLAQLQGMAQAAGWSERGGKLLRDDGAEGEVTGRTKWLPTEAWFAGKPAGVTEQHMRSAVDKVASGRGILTKPERDGLAYMQETLRELESQDRARQNEEASRTAELEALADQAAAELSADEIEAIREQLAVQMESATQDDYLLALKEAFHEKAIQSRAGREAGQADARGAREGVPEGRTEGRREASAFSLESQTEQDLAARDVAQREAAERDQREQQERERKAQADAERGSFTLTGSDRAADVQAAMGQGGLFDAPAPQRFEAGKALTKEQRAAVLKTLTDVYRAKNAPKEFKGVDQNGNERSGYAHSPELFEKSDITGSMVRYYVTLPDGRIAHPTELFPDYTQAQIDAAMAEQEAADRQRTDNDKSRIDTLSRRKADTLNEANRLFNTQNRGREDYVPATLTDGKQFIRTHPDAVANDLRLLGDGWREAAQPAPAEPAQPRAEQGERADISADTRTPKEIAVATVREVAQARPFEAYESVRDEALKLVKERTGKSWSDLDTRSSMFADELADAIHDGQLAGQREYAATLPVDISESGISTDSAVRAFSGTSHSPEKRAASLKRGIFRDLMGLWRKLERAYNAAPDDRKQAFVEAFNDIAARYKGMVSTYLASHSRVMSSMIVGPARFPVESNRKKSEAADAKLKAAEDFLAVAPKRLLKVLRGAVDNSVQSALNEAESKLAAREAQQARMKKINAAHAKFLKDPASLDKSDLSDADKNLIRTHKPRYSWEPHPYAPYELTNNNAEIRRLKGRVDELKRRIEEADTVAEQDEDAEQPTDSPVRIVRNAQAGRLQLFFNGKPSEEVRTALKASGFKWAPSASAWQRMLTDNAIADAERIVREHFGIQRSFAGESARTADTHALATAQRRLAAGEDAETVRQETGWHKGPDGKWRFEIDDSDAALLPALQSLGKGGYDAREIASVTYRKRDDGTYDLTLNPPSPQSTSDFVVLNAVRPEVMRAVLPDAAARAIERNAGTEDFIGDLEEAKRIDAAFTFDGFNALPLDQVIDHPALFAAYPALRDVMVQVDPKLGKGGSFSLTEHADGAKTQVIRIGKGQQLSTLLHEIQHGIQDIEGFASGGRALDPAGDGYAMKVAAGINARYAKRLDELRDAGKWDESAALDEKRRAEVEAVFKEDGAFGSLYYKRLAGEAEARNTQTRQKLTAAERRAKSPESTADVKAPDVIVVFNGTEMASAPSPANATPNGTTESAIRSAIASLIGPLRTKRVIVAQSADELVAQGILTAEQANGAQAFVKDGKAYFIAGNIQPGNERAVFLHEVGSHLGLEKLLSPFARKVLLTKIRNWSQESGTVESRIAKAAQRRVEAAGEAGNESELLAYFVEEAVKAGIDPTAESSSAIGQWFRSFMASVRTALEKLGLINPKQLTAQDIVDMARGAAGVALEQEATGATQFSRADQIDSPAFRAWFKDSKVVDADGKPLVVYHGTDKDIKSFKPGRGSKAIWFAADSSLANEFVAGGRRNMTGGAKKGSAIYPVYLAMRKPLDLGDASPQDFAAYWYPLEVAGLPADFAAVSEIARRSIEMGYAGVSSTIANPVEYLAKSFMSGRNRLSDVLDNPALIEMLQEAGFDGIKMNEQSTVIFAAFSPDQIKSAIGNNGNFDPNDARIQFSRAASTIAPVWDVPESSKLFGRFDADSLLYTLQDKHIDTKRVVEAIRKQSGDIADEFNPYLQEELFHGRSAKGVKDFLDGELRPLLSEMSIRKVGMEELEKYLHARHAEERNIQIAKINPKMPDGGSGMTTQDAKDYIAALDPARKALLDKLAAKIDTINAATRDVLVQSGLEKPETIKAWEGAYKHYVPLQREEVESHGLGIGQGFSVKGSASKRAMGSDKPVADIIANIAMQRERAIVRAEKNRVSQALYGLSLKAPNPDFWMTINPAEAKAFTPKQQQTVIDELTSLGLDPADALNFVKEPTQRYIDPRTGLVAERINPVMRSAPNVLAVRINGEDRYVFFNAGDERASRMVHALKNLDADQLGRLLQTSAKITRWFASVNTQYNPVFGAINILRDVQGAMLNLSTTPIRGKEVKVLADTASALKGIYSDLRAIRKGGQASSPWASLWEEFQREGGQTGYRDMFSNSAERAEAIQKELDQIGEGKLKHAGRALFDWLSDYNEAMENAVRLAAYKEAKDAGLSNEKAASLAKNLTVNFNRKGQITTQAGALYAFYNAATQGTFRMAQTLAGPAGRKIILGGLMLGSMQAMLLAAAGFDDDEPPEFVRERSLIIPTGGGKYLAIPMPLGYHVIPSTSRIITEWALSGFTRTGDRIASLLGLFADTFNPIGNAGWSMQTLAPTALDPFAALAENKDWSGKPIAREDMSALDPTPGHTRAKDTASWMSKMISYWANLATGGTDYKPGLVSPTPDQIDYLIGQFTGGVGREAMKTEQTVTSLMTGEDLPPHKIPLVGRFYGDTTGQSSEANRFYSNLREVNLHKSEIDGRRKNGEDVFGYLQDNPTARLSIGASRFETQIRKLKQARRDAMKNDADPEAVRRIDAQITSVMHSFNQRFADLEKSAQ